PSNTALDLPMDVVGSSRDEAYALTHFFFYLTDFGNQSEQLRIRRPLATVLAEAEALLLRYLDAEDYDVCGELLCLWPLARVPWNPSATFAFRVLMRVEDEVGLLPSGNVDLSRLNRLEGDAQTTYALGNAYHTVL